MQIIIKYNGFCGKNEPIHWTINSKDKNQNITGQNIDGQQNNMLQVKLKPSGLITHGYSYTGVYKNN